MMKTSGYLLKLIHLFVLTTAFGFLGACSGGDSGGGGGGFAFLDNPADGSLDVACEISSFTPTTAATKVSALGNTPTTFAVTPNNGSCTAQWSINGINVTGNGHILAVTGSQLSAGVNEVKVVVTNSKGSAQKAWTVTKNTVPVCGSRTPSGVSFGLMAGQTQNMLINVTDADNDSMSFSWKLNGQTAAGVLDVMLSSASASQASFAPGVSQIGSNAIEAVVNDGYDSVSCSWTVTVAGACSILSSNPAGGTVRVNNAGSTQTTFQVTTDSAGCPVTWTLNGSTLTGTDGSRIVGSSDLLVGANVLQASITSGGTTTTRTWTVRRNALPQCSQSPAGSSTLTTGVGMSLALTANLSDTDADPISVSWQINGVTPSASVFSSTGNASQSVGTFTPNTAAVGNSVVTAILNDGYESNSCNWPVRTVPDCSVSSSFPAGATKKISTSPVSTTAFGVVPNDSGCSVTWTLNGSNIGSGNIVNVQSNNVNLTDGNTNTLVATLSNGVNPAVTRTWSVDRNIAPACASQSPLASGNSMTSVQTLGLSATITNTDNDPITYAWKLNGSSSAMFGTLTSSSTTASAVFSPTAGTIGNNQNIKLQFNDGYDAGECSWFVDITDPATVNITSCTPAGTSATLLSEDPDNPGNYDTEAFVVSATGPGLTYQWKRDGTNIPGATSTNFSTSSNPSGGWPSGVHALQALVTDAYGNSQSCNWSLKKNDKPIIDSWAIRKDGVNLSTSAGGGPSIYKLNYNSTLDFQAFAHDPNSEDASSFTYRWKLDGALMSAGSSTLGYTIAGDKSYSTATLNPAGNALLVGTHTVTVSAWDGSEERTTSWNVQINRFSDPCNTVANSNTQNMTCVYTGISSIGEGENPESNTSKILMRAGSIYFHTDGNAFITDYSNHMVWYWNRGVSTTIFGLNVPANSMRVVAGAGYAANFGDGFHATRALLSSPSYALYDGTNLYISDTGNNRVRMVNSSGIISTIMGGGASDVSGVTGTTARCDDPRTLLMVSANNLLVSCRNRHFVKRIDLTSPTFNTYNYAGSGATAAPADNNNYVPTATTINTPWGVVKDHLGNVFIAEEGGCRIRAINNTAGVMTFLGVAINAGSMKTIYGPTTSNTCNWPTTSVSSPRGMMFDPTSKVLYFTNTGSNRDGIYAMNLSNSYGTGASVLYGSGGAQVTVTAGSVARIAGNGTAGYLGEGNYAQSTRFSDPRDLTLEPTQGHLYVADVGNFRLRRLIADNRTELVAGTGAVRVGNAGNAGLDATAEKMNQPRNVLYDRFNDSLFVADTTNYRVRQIDRFGLASLVVGTGSTGSGAEEEELPTAVTLANPRGMVFVGENSGSNFAGHIVYSDASNHRVRFWNRGGSAVTYFGISIPAGTVKTIAGTGFAGNVTSGAAIAADLNNPDGVAYDGTNLYIADSSNHCIKKVDSSGTISAVAGTCGTAGNVNGPVGTGRLNTPAGIAYADMTIGASTHRGIFIADRANSRVKFLRLSGPTAIANTTVPLNEAHDIACGGAKHDDEVGSLTASCNGVYDVTMLSGPRVCFSNFSYHNVRCVNLSDGKIYTVMGPLQGETQGASNVPFYFPGTSLGADDQNNVLAAIGLATPGLVNPPVTQKLGRLASPMGLTSDRQNTLFITEYNTALIRKVLVP